MQETKNQKWRPTRLPFLFLFTLIIVLIYSNSFNASWHLDDRSNIVDNRGLHISNLQIVSLARTFFTAPESGGAITDRLYRPIPCLTFAINWYFGKDRVFGYHVVNILIHILTAYLLFLAILNILKSPNLKNKYKDKENFVAFLAAVLWAINPIQVQTVTYIVQRMASMAAMFYILSIYLYLKTRQSQQPLCRTLLLLGCTAGFLLALGSKENAATLPLAIILIEIICFQDLNSRKVRRTFFWGTIAGGGLLVVFGALLFLPVNPFTFIKSYGGRPFTLFERLLTEPRIVLFYLSLIFYPLPARLSIEHDIIVSSSLSNPWTTLPAILFHLVLIGIGFFQIRKRPLLALAILFFYLNHVIESTIMPLELIFEHRNYLPSLFLFLPVAAGFKALLDHYEKRSRAFRSVLVCSSILIILGIGGGTYIRNLAWATEKTLWEDAMHKAPDSHRPLHNLAWAHYVKIGQYDKAIELYEKSLDLRTNNNFANPTAMSNLGLLYVHKKKYQKAIELWQSALELRPNDDVIRYRYVVGLIEMKNWRAALDNLNQMMRRHPSHFDYTYLKGYVLLNQNHYEAALKYFEQCLNLVSENQQAMLGAGICNNLMGHYKRAEAIFRRVLEFAPNDDLALLWLVETNLSVGDGQDADRYLKELLAIVPSDQLLVLLQGDPGKNFLPAASKEKIMERIKSL
ncbi:MAG: tetratricopeptide repeat protein [Deltaproteobacteria bacterium]|jgi:tetratricopeptide (TPR) repeat protein